MSWSLLFHVFIERSETPPNHLGLDFHIYVYIRTYVSNTRARVSDLR